MKVHFFEDFTIVIPAVVRKECDMTRSGKKELKRLATFASIGRIKLETAGKVEEIPDELSSTRRDEMIADIALKYNAILITADNAMKAYESPRAYSQYSSSKSYVIKIRRNQDICKTCKEFVFNSKWRLNEHENRVNII